MALDTHKVTAQLKISASNKTHFDSCDPNYRKSEKSIRLF